MHGESIQTSATANFETMEAFGAPLPSEQYEGGSLPDFKEPPQQRSKAQQVTCGSAHGPHLQLTQDAAQSTQSCCLDISAAAAPHFHVLKTRDPPGAESDNSGALRLSRPNCAVPAEDKELPLSKGPRPRRDKHIISVDTLNTTLH
uniref:Uncharacterized protein n=1 Tax=Knipowitschia caucasica TaxID=637954 RepID=A0AAV2JVW4_KNICA